MNYWMEALSTALDEEGVTLSSEVVANLAKQMQFAHEMYAEATGALCIPNPLKTEISSLQKRMAEKEREANERYERMRAYAAQQVAWRNGVNVDSVVVWDHYGSIQAEQKR